MEALVQASCCAVISQLSPVVPLVDLCPGASSRTAGSASEHGEDAFCVAVVPPLLEHDDPDAVARVWRISVVGSR